ncbi:UDP-galactose/UDP-glucose transporter 3 [Asimina triloba]
MEGSATGIGRVLVLAFCVAGIWSAYITQGVLQETLSTKRFGPDGKRFEHLAFLNLAQNVVCFFWSLLMMLMGTLIYGIKYTFPEYVCTFLVAGGVSAFALMKTSSKTISKLAHPNAPLGYALCFMNLAFDGFTNATQDSITARYPKTTAWDIMLGMNLWGSIYNVIYMFGLASGSGFEAVQFCREHPEAAWDIFLFCLCGAVGQNFIFLTISRFGSLANTTITTTRKFASIVVSSLLSGNPLSAKQWGSVIMVFSGLTYQIYLKWRKLQNKKKSM